MKVFLIAVQAVFYILAQLHAVVYPHPVGMVYLHHDFVVGTYLYVHEEVLGVFEPLIYQILYDVSVYHSV